MDGLSISLTLSRVKQQAQNLRQILISDGIKLSHSRALECVSRIYGYKDWNTFRTKLPADTANPNLIAGEQVSGVYLGQEISGKVLELKPFGTQGFMRIVVGLDKPIDVAKSKEFSALRHRISAEISPQGRTIETTSDGQPQLTVVLN